MCDAISRRAVYFDPLLLPGLVSYLMNLHSLAKIRI